MDLRFEIVTPAISAEAVRSEMRSASFIDGYARDG